MSGDVEETVIGHIPSFRRGDTVSYGGNSAVIDYLIIRNGDLLVCLHAHVDPVPVRALSAPLWPVIWNKRLK
jgi:hypothetical protein